MTTPPPPVNNPRRRQQEVRVDKKQQRREFHHVPNQERQQQPYPYYNPTLMAQQHQQARARRKQSYLQKLLKPREVDYSSLTSFLCKDNSFFSPWSWVPDDGDAPVNRDKKGQERIMLQPGSFFSQEIPPMKHEEGPRKSPDQECKESSKLRDKTE